MKNILTKCFAAALLTCCGFVPMACNNNDPAEELTYNTFQKATISGRVLMNNDYTVTEQKWAAAPASIQIVVEVPNSSITGVAGAEGVYRTNATYNASNGEYTVDVPVSNLGSIVTITVKNWTGFVKLHEVLPADPNNPGAGDQVVTAEYSVLWHAESLTAFAKPGDHSINHVFIFDGEGYEPGQYAKLIGVGSPAN